MKLTSEEVEWVVNDNTELGVKIGNQFFFMYKGGSLVYGMDGQQKDGIALHDSRDDGGAEPMHWRYVFKRRSSAPMMRRTASSTTRCALGSRR